VLERLPDGESRRVWRVDGRRPRGIVGAPVTERLHPRWTDRRASARRSGKPGAAASSNSRADSTRDETPEELIHLARGGSTTDGPTQSVSEVQRLAPLRGVGRRGCGRRGAPPRGGAGKTLRRPHPRGWGGEAGGWRGHATRSWVRAGSLPDGGVRIRSIPRIGGSWVHEPRRRNSGLANVARWLGSPRRVGWGLVPDPVRFWRDTGPRPFWRRL